MQTRATFVTELGTGRIRVFAECALEREHGYHLDGKTTRYCSQESLTSSRKQRKFSVHRNLRNATARNIRLHPLDARPLSLLRLQPPHYRHSALVVKRMRHAALDQHGHGLVHLVTDHATDSRLDKLALAAHRCRFGLGLRFGHACLAFWFS